MEELTHKKHHQLNLPSESSTISRQDSTYSEENEIKLKHDSDSSSRAAFHHTSSPETLHHSGFGSGIFKSTRGGPQSSKELSMDICSVDGS